MIQRARVAGCTHGEMPQPAGCLTWIIYWRTINSEPLSAHYECDEHAFESRGRAQTCSRWVQVSFNAVGDDYLHARPAELGGHQDAHHS
jgi:hypothetical protein